MISLFAACISSALAGAALGDGDTGWAACFGVLAVVNARLAMAALS